MKNFINKKIVYFFPSDAKEKEWQYFHFIHELQKEKIAFDLFNPHDFGKDYESVLLKKMIKEKKEISLFMTASFDGEISVKTLEEIKKIGIPTLLICYDNLSIPFVHKNTARIYDLVWLTSYETEGMFRKWGANTIFLPYAANPFVFMPRPHNGEKHNGVGFIGSCYGNRIKILNMLAKSGIQTDVYTNMEKNKGINKPPIIKHLNSIAHSAFYFSNLIQFSIGRQCILGSLLKSFYNSNNFNFANEKLLSINPSVSFDKMIELYSSFTLTYNNIDLLDTFMLRHPISKIHLRVFEVPMSGGIQITRATDEIREYFEEDKEIILFNTDDELVDKCRHYLKNRKSVSKMKQNARKRAISDHTWSSRFTKIHDKLF